MLKYAHFTIFLFTQCQLLWLIKVYSDRHCFSLRKMESRFAQESNTSSFFELQELIFALGLGDQCAPLWQMSVAE
jgi:hypothetical protein